MFLRVFVRFRRADESVRDATRRDAAAGGGPEWTMDCGLRLLLSTVLCLSQSLLVCCSCKSSRRLGERSYLIFLGGIKELGGLIVNPALTALSPWDEPMPLRFPFPAKKKKKGFLTLQNTLCVRSRIRMLIRGKVQLPY